MRRSRQLAILAVLSIAGWCAAQTGPSSQPVLPTRLQPFAPLVKQCALHQQLLAGTAWRVVHRESFSAAGQQGWKVVSPVTPPDQPPTRHAREDGRDVLLFTVEQTEQGLLAVGPTVKGSFAIEFTAKSVGQRTCDLSIVTDAVGGGPALQFGGYDNTRNILWTGQRKEADGKTSGQRVDLPADGPRIEPNRWHRVRLEVREGAVWGYVDGRLVGTAVLADAHDPAKAMQPMIYTYNSGIAIDEATIEEYRGRQDRADHKTAWAKAFGQSTPQEVSKKIAALVDLLADDDWRVRDGAEAMLAEAGELAIEPLKMAVENGTPEQAQRAGSVLRLLKPQPAPAPPPAKPVPPGPEVEMQL